MNDENLDRVIDQVRRSVAGLLAVDPASIDPEVELTDQGLDSVRMMDVVAELREAGYDADFADLAEDSRLVAWRDLLADEDQA